MPGVPFYVSPAGKTLTGVVVSGEPMPQQPAPTLPGNDHIELTRDYVVRLDLSKLSWKELLHLQSGIESETERRKHNDGTSRCWIVPSDTVEVFVAK